MTDILPSPSDEATINDRIVVEAERFVGLSEAASNARWKDPDLSNGDQAEIFRNMLLATGWQSGWAYCMAAVEAIWRKAYLAAGGTPAIDQWLACYLTPSVMTSYRNVRSFEPHFSRVPQKGGIMFMRHGNTWSGHAGIVAIPGQARVSTIEANTSPAAATVAADRQGDGIYRKTRPMNFTPTAGLYLLGFFNPPPLTALAKWARAMNKPGVKKVGPT